jgi:hypothetical protein
MSCGQDAIRTQFGFYRLFLYVESVTFFKGTLQLVISTNTHIEDLWKFLQQKWYQLLIQVFAYSSLETDSCWNLFVPEI